MKKAKAKKIIRRMEELWDASLGMYDDPHDLEKYHKACRRLARNKRATNG